MSHFLLDNHKLPYHLLWKNITCISAEMILRFASKNAIRDLDLNDERNDRNLSNGNTFKKR